MQNEVENRKIALGTLADPSNAERVLHMRLEVANKELLARNRVVVGVDELKAALKELEEMRHFVIELGGRLGECIKKENGPLASDLAPDDRAYMVAIS